MKINKKLLLILAIIYKIYFVTVIMLLFSIDKTNTTPEKILASPIYEVKIAKKILINDKTPLVKPSDSYTILLVGDSMTDTLRPHDNNFLFYLNEYYPDKTFEIINYGYGSTNILSLPERLNEKTTYLNVENPPILEQEFDIIFIESFGHNPLSEYSLEEGLIKHNQALTDSIISIQETHPNSLIVLMSTIAPNKDNFAKGTVELNAAQRQSWVNERVNYIRNHILFAKSHNLPYLDIFEKSLGPDDTGDQKYIYSGDNIHPSYDGINLIHEEIAKFIYENRLLPL